MLDLLEHLLYYDPKLRLTAEAAMAHAFFSETECYDEANPNEGTDDANQESEDPDNTSQEKKGGQGLDRHGTNRGIIIADETNEERLQRSHQRLAFITENDHLMRRINGKKEKSGSKASSTILGKRNDHGVASANRTYKSTDILPLSLQKNTVKAQFDLPTIPLSPFEFGEGWPPQRNSSISSFTDSAILSLNQAGGTSASESSAFAASIGSLLEDMRNVANDNLMQQTPFKQPATHSRQTERFSAPSSYQEASLQTKIRQTRRTLSSEEHHIVPLNRSSIEMNTTVTKIERKQDHSEHKLEMKRQVFTEIGNSNVFALSASPLETTEQKKQYARPLSDIPSHTVTFGEWSAKGYGDQRTSLKVMPENVPPPTANVPQSLNSSLSTPLSSVANPGTFRKLAGRTGFQSAHRNVERSSPVLPRSATYETLQTSSHFVKKQERNRIGQRFRQSAAHSDSTKHATSGSSGFFSFKKRSPWVLKDKVVNSLQHGDIDPLQEDLPYHPMQASPFHVQPPTRTSSARPSEYHYRPQSNGTSVRQPSSFEIMIAEEIEQAWAPQPIRIPQVTTSRVPEDRQPFL
jgi:hypothetical protein